MLSASSDTVEEAFKPQQKQQLNRLLILLHVTTWIETHMLGEFYSSEKCPYIETYLPQ